MNIKEILANPASLSGGENIDKAITWVRTTGSKFDLLVHATACAIIAHAEATGDCSRALRLVEAMPKSARRAALIRWLTAFSPISVYFSVDVKKRRVGLRKPDQRNYNAFNVAGARENPYYEWDKSEDNALAALLTVGDVNSKIVKLIDFIETRETKGEVKPEDKLLVETRVTALRAALVA